MDIKLLSHFDDKKVKDLLLNELLELGDDYDKDQLLSELQKVNEEIAFEENKLTYAGQDFFMDSEINNRIQNLKIIQDTYQKKIEKIEKVEDILERINDIDKARRAEIVASAGSLSRFAGDVLEIVGVCEEKTLEQNSKFISRVIGMGHDSITDHDYCVFAIKDVSPVVEQVLIEERFASFTIKSRREVDFSDVGFYVPDFHDKDGNVLPNNDKIKEEYFNYMKSLFSKYKTFVDNGIPKEDARFILPYCYHSNIIMGMDAHCVKNLIIKLTKTKYSKIQELREFGEKLYSIVKDNISYLVPVIDAAPFEEVNSVDCYLSDYVNDYSYQSLNKPILLNELKSVDDDICVAAFMRRYQFDREKAMFALNKACEINPGFKEELIRKIIFEGDGLELTQVNFDFQIPLSLAILTHLTRHRTHHIMTPGFVPNLDLSQYKIPPTIIRTCRDEYDKIFSDNLEMYGHFKNDYCIRDEDLVYFSLSGTLTNSITSMDGKTVEHILRLRECHKAQWETQAMSREILHAIKNLPGAEIFSSMLGATCITQGICNEGRECCGRVYKLSNRGKK